MKKLILGLFCLLSALPVMAGKTEKANELMKLMNAQSIMDAAYKPAMAPLMCQFIIPEAEEEMLKKDFFKALKADKLTHALSKFWIDNYTEEELDDILHFYKTKAGQKVLTLLPEYTQFSIIEMQKWKEEVGPGLINLGQGVAKKYRQRSGEEINACLEKTLGKPAMAAPKKGTPKKANTSVKKTSSTTTKRKK